MSRYQLAVFEKDRNYISPHFILANMCTFVLHVTTFVSPLQSVPSLVLLGTILIPLAVDVSQSTSVSPITPVRMEEHVSLGTATPTTTACAVHHLEAQTAVSYEY